MTRDLLDIRGRIEDIWDWMSIPRALGTIGVLGLAYGAGAWGKSDVEAELETYRGRQCAGEAPICGVDGKLQGFEVAGGKGFLYFDEKAKGGVAALPYDQESACVAVELRRGTVEEPEAEEAKE